MEKDVKMTKQSIPIVIGVTGRCALREQDLSALRAAVTGELEKLMKQYPHSEFVMLNSIARGAGTLCAECALELGMKLWCPLPLSAGEYRKDFSAEDAAVFDRLLGRADEVFVTPDTETTWSAGQAPEPVSDRDFHYRQAGLYVAMHSHILMALWEGNDPKPGGYGAAEIVDAVLNGSCYPPDGRTLYTGENSAVLQIFTPRSRAEAGLTEETDVSGFEEKPAGEITWHGDEAGLRKLLEQTDEFNRLTAAHPAGKSGVLIPEGDAGKDPVLDRTERLYDAADRISVAYAERFRRTLAFLAVIGTVVTLAFLLYDEAEMHFMILVCGAMLVFAAVCRYYAVRSDCQRRYIEFRTLAEGLRVQAFLRYAGSAASAAEFFSWSQRVETAWIMRALMAVSAGRPPEERHDITDCWVRNQRDYHRNAAKRTGFAFARSERIVNIALVLSIAVYLIALVFELTAGSLGIAPVRPAARPDFWRMILKIVLGSISAGTLFMGNYYGKQSLPRRVSDHEKMALFYEKAEKQIGMSGQSEAVLLLLAREELVENSNWCSYQRDNKPDISL